MTHIDESTCWGSEVQLLTYPSSGLASRAVPGESGRARTCWRRPGTQAALENERNSLPELRCLPLRCA